MESEVHWLIPQRIIRVAPQGQLTAAALDAAVEHSRHALAHETAHPVHILLDLTATQRDETLIVKIKQTVDELRGLQPAPPRAGWTIVIDTMPNQIVKSIGASITQAIRVRTRFVTQVVDAVEFLEKIDPTLSSAGTAE
jgi:hypothetical protein